WGKWAVMGVGSLLAPEITAGTRPARRSARAAPLPPRGRAVAFSSWTVAIVLYPLEFDDGIAAACLQGCRGRSCAGLYPQDPEMETGIRPTRQAAGGVGSTGGGGDAGAAGPPASFASKAASRVRNTSFSSRASR